MKIIAKRNRTTSPFFTQLLVLTRSTPRIFGYFRKFFKGFDCFHQKHLTQRVNSQYFFHKYQPILSSCGFDNFMGCLWPAVIVLNGRIEIKLDIVFCHSHYETQFSDEKCFIVRFSRLVLEDYPGGIVVSSPTMLPSQIQCRCLKCTKQDITGGDKKTLDYLKEHSKC